jgi:Bacterial archaeo-eukaryotic release factor family 7
MQTLSRQELDRIVASEGGPHLSMFLPGTAKQFTDKPVTSRIAGLSTQARQTLSTHWMTPSQAESFLEPLDHYCKDTTIQANSHQPLAIFLSSDLFKAYGMIASVEQQLTISQTFCMRPILPSIEPFATFYLLTLSSEVITLFQVTPHSIERFDQFAQPTGGGISNRGRSVVYHGQDGFSSIETRQLADYLREVDEAVCAALKDNRELLVLAGIDPLTTLFKKISNYPRLASDTIAGSVDRLRPDQLFQRAMTIALAEVALEREADVARVRRRLATVATTPEQVLAATGKGAAEALFIEKAATLFGSFCPETQTLQELSRQPPGAPDDLRHDLIEMAIVQTLRHRGRVHCLPMEDMPAKSKMLACLRCTQPAEQAVIRSANPLQSS